jgi:DNA polymerase
MTASKEDRYKAIVSDITKCERCYLHKVRGGPAVVGQGNLRAEIVFVGEAPGKWEEKYGMPFWPDAPAGKILQEVLDQALELRRRDVFICNTVCCRPKSDKPGRENDPPSVDAKLSCLTHFSSLLNLVDPKIVIALGGHAGNALLPGEMTTGRMRRKLWWYHHYPVIVTWHPSYVCRKGGVGCEQWHQFRRDLLVALFTIERVNPMSNQDIRSQFESAARAQIQLANEAEAKR